MSGNNVYKVCKGFCRVTFGREMMISVFATNNGLSLSSSARLRALAQRGL
jgi:hypothetical protein